MDTGLRSKYTSRCRRAWPQLSVLSVRHMAAVLNGKGEDENINLVAERPSSRGLSRAAPRRRPCAATSQGRRQGSRQQDADPLDGAACRSCVGQSRAESPAARRTRWHLLSHVYDAATDSYVPIKEWVNPKDDDDFVLTATLAGRYAREKEFDRLASKMNIVANLDLAISSYNKVSSK